MPALVAPLYGVSLGALLATLAGESVSRSSPAVRLRALLLVVGLGLLVFAPGAGYFVAQHGDWAYGYLLPASRRPALLDVAVLLVDVAAVPLGFAPSLAAGSRGQRRRLALLLGPLFLGTLLVAGFLPRLRVLGTHAQYHGDFGTEPLVGGAASLALLWTALVVVAASAWTLRALRSGADGGARTTAPSARARTGSWS